MSRNPSLRPETTAQCKSNARHGSLPDVLSLIRYIAPYRLWMFAGIALIFAGTTVGLIFPLLAGGLVDAALHRGIAHLPWLGQITLNRIAVILAVTVTLQALAGAGAALAFNRFGQNMLVNIRKQMYGWLLGLPMAFFAERRIGELTSRMSSDIGQIEGVLTTAFPQLCRQFVLLAGGITLLVITSPRLTLVMLGTVPMLIAAAIIFGRKMRRISRETQDHLAATNTIMEETLHSISCVKAFANESFEMARFHRANTAVHATAIRAARWRAAFFAAFTFALFGSIVIVLWYGAQLMLVGRITPGELTRFVLYSMFVAGGLGQSAELYSQIQRMLGATHRVRELLKEKPESSGGISTHATAPLRQPNSRLRGAVKFDHVSFSYPGNPEMPVLRDVSLMVEPGETLALVGRSGAGKSTLTSLLLRFYNPKSGRILIDAYDAYDYDLHWLRAQMALVPQDVLLFGGTIAENIGYGRPGATEADIRGAAGLANLDEFIVKLPKGYATWVGERGTKLSVGQRQRIAIARAILKDPAILILDEATSSLDSESEQLVQGALKTLMHGRTTFIIAHRLGTVRRASQIAVLDEGRIVELGKHEDLSSRVGGLYHRLTELQFGGVLQP